MSSVANPTPTITEGGSPKRVESASTQSLLSNVTSQITLPSSPLPLDQSPQPISSTIKKTSSDFSLDKTQISMTSSGPSEKTNSNDIEKMLFSHSLFAAELDSANWERSLSCIDDVDFAENEHDHIIPWGCPRRLRCPVCAFLDKESCGRNGTYEGNMGNVISQFGWVIDRSEEVNKIFAEFQSKDVNKEMSERLKEVIKMLKDQLNETVDKLFQNEMNRVLMFEKRQAKINYRYRILNEIASTEKDYYNSLVIVKNTWKADFIASGLLEPAVIEQLFLNVDDLAMTTEKMIKKMDVEKEKDYNDQLVGKIFVDLIPELKGYIDYCSMQDRALRVYAELIKSNGKFRELVTVNN